MKQNKFQDRTYYNEGFNFNIDKIPHKKFGEYLSNWSQKMRGMMHFLPHNTDAEGYLHYATSHWQGNALAWLRNLDRSNPDGAAKIKQEQDKGKALDELLILLLADFTGEEAQKTKDYDKNSYFEKDQYMKFS